MIPIIHQLLQRPLSGPEIEARSFSIIDNECLPNNNLSNSEWEIARRLIHTTGDVSCIHDLAFSHHAIAAGIKALRNGRPIYVDANMIRSGISLPRLQRVNPMYQATSIISHIADPDVADLANQHRLPRSLYAIRKAKAMIDGGIMIFGNAPVALLELNRMIIEDGIRPALIIAMPVGFVHVVESKEEVLALDVPTISLMGRRGGSPLAVATLHALCTLAERCTP